MAMSVDDFLNGKKRPALGSIGPGLVVGAIYDPATVASISILIPVTVGGKWRKMVDGQPVSLPAWLSPDEVVVCANSLKNVVGAGIQFLGNEKTVAFGAIVAPGGKVVSSDVYEILPEFLPKVWTGPRPGENHGLPWLPDSTLDDLKQAVEFAVQNKSHVNANGDSFLSSVSKSKIGFPDDVKSALQDASTAFQPKPTPSKIDIAAVMAAIQQAPSRSSLDRAVSSMFGTSMSSWQAMSSKDRGSVFMRMPEYASAGWKAAPDGPCAVVKGPDGLVVTTQLSFADLGKVSGFTSVVWLEAGMHFSVTVAKESHTFLWNGKDDPAVRLMVDALLLHEDVPENRMRKAVGMAAGPVARMLSKMQSISPSAPGYADDMDFLDHLESEP